MQWQDYLLRYGSHSAQLRDEVAALARHLTNNIVEWSHIRALMSSRLVDLDKCPGVRPIAITKELRRTVCKALAFATGSDVAEFCGVSQLFSGLEAGIEGAVHAIRELFEDNWGSGWGLLLQFPEQSSCTMECEGSMAMMLQVLIQHQLWLCLPCNAGEF